MVECQFLKSTLELTFVCADGICREEWADGAGVEDADLLICITARPDGMFSLCV